VALDDGATDAQAHADAAGFGGVERPEQPIGVAGREPDAAIDHLEPNRRRARRLTEITVKIHRRKAMQKMEASSLAELVRTCERLERLNDLVAEGRSCHRGGSARV
jgi:regulatory LuxR family protein